MNEREIEVFKKECLGKNTGYDKTRYCFVYLHEKIVVTEYCSQTTYVSGDRWYYLRPISKAVEFANHLAKERGWKLVAVHTIVGGKLITSGKLKNRRLVGDIHAFAGIPFFQNL